MDGKYETIYTEDERPRVVIHDQADAKTAAQDITLYHRILATPKQEYVNYTSHLGEQTTGFPRTLGFDMSRKIIEGAQLREEREAEAAKNIAAILQEFELDPLSEAAVREAGLTAVVASLRHQAEQAHELGAAAQDTIHPIAV